VTSISSKLQNSAIHRKKQFSPLLKVVLFLSFFFLFFLEEEERMSPGRWLHLLLYVPFSASTLVAGW